MHLLKRDLKIAHHIQRYLQALERATWQEHLRRFSHVQSELDRLSACLERFQKCLNRRWDLAAERLRHRIGRQVLDLAYALEHSQRLSAEAIRIPGLSVLVADLQQIDREWGTLEYDPKAEVLALVTDSIELQGIYLGPFEIRLELAQLADLNASSPYTCVALEPCSPPTAEYITHPHINHDRVCEGDGMLAIRKALKEGRLYDFFSLVVGILKTYNPDSAYVRLEDWEGLPCWDCGQVIAEDEVYHCETCHHDFCSACSSYCQLCDATCCLGCALECPGCRNLVCRACVQECKGCKEMYCTDCLEGDLCPRCIEERQDHEHETHDETMVPSGHEPSPSPSPGAVPAVQPDGLGQAVVLSR